MSITVSKKSNRRFFVFGSIFALLLICFSCSLESNFPLSYSSNCHETRLEGAWICREKGWVVVIRDMGTKYMALFFNENFNEKEAEKGVDARVFILTKLDSYYFISVKDDWDKGEDEKPNWYIYRIQFKGNKLLVLDLNEQGIEKFKEGCRKSQRELQQWCVRNANLFTDEFFCFERE